MAKQIEKQEPQDHDAAGHLVMQSGGTFHLTHAGARALGNGRFHGDVIAPGSADAAALVALAKSGAKVNLKLQRLHSKLAAEGKNQLQLPAGTSLFASKGIAAQKAVDAQLLAAAPFPKSEGLQYLPLHRLTENPKNPRQDFGDPDDLAASIKASGGLLVPIIARPKDDELEIVDGARRYRALKVLAKAGDPIVDMVPVDVRELTDAQASEAMMMADQRETLKPMEQARGYANMLATGHTVDTIAEQLGVSKGTVHGRLKLLELSERAQYLFGLGVLTTAIATPLGRYPKELQDEALEQMLSDKHKEGAGGANLWRRGEYSDRYTGGSFHEREKKLNVGMCIAWLQEHFTKSLKTTPWDQEDATIQVPMELWPTLEPLDTSPGDTHGEVTAPSCKACPKNSNNMPQEVAGENPHGRSSAGFCTLPPCFEAKWAESIKRLRTEAKEKGDVKVLGESASRAALKKITNSDSRYAKASEVCHEDPKKRTWGQLRDLANKNIDESEQIREVVAISEEGKARLIEKAEVQKVLAAEKVLPMPKAPKKERDYYAEQREQYERQQAMRALREGIATDVLEKYAKRVREKGPTLPMLRLLVELAESQVGSSGTAEQIFGLKSRRELDTFVEKKASVNDLVALLYIHMADGETRAFNGFSEEIERAAKELGIDLKKREKDAVAAAKLAEKQAAGEKETLEEGDE